MGKLEQRVALITGSAQGMGAGIARLFHAENARVMLHGLEEAAGRALAAELTAQGGDADFVGGDLRQAETSQALVAATAARFGALDLIIHSAGDTRRGTVETTSAQLWDEIFAVNVRAAFLLVQAALPWLRRSAHASVVLIGSINAYIGEPKLMAYSASKGALMTLTRNLASGLNRERIRVNLINPGWTLTEGEQRVKTQDEGNPAWLEEAVKTRPFGRLLLPADVARAALFFAGPDSDTITGSVLDYEQYPIGAPPNW